MHLITALGIVLIVTSIIGIVQEANDKNLRWIAVATLISGLFFGLYYHVPILRDIAPRSALLYDILAVLAASLSVMIVLKQKNKIAGSCCIFAGLLIAGLSLGILQY